MWNLFQTIVLISVVYSCNFINNSCCRKSETIALVLARGGSKGIPMKNLAKINNVTLLGRSLTTLQKSNIFKKIYVSSDHEDILREAEKYNATIHRRPLKYALDNTSSIESVQEFLKHHPEIQNIALIQCTSVFLIKKYLLTAMSLFNNFDCVFAVTRSHKLRWSYDENAKQLRSLNFDPERRPRRQDWKGELIETGMFYFSERRLIMDGKFQNSNCNYVEIENGDALEIDSMEDLKLARYLVEQKMEPTN